LKQESAVGLDFLIVQAEGNIVSDMDGEKVMLSIKNGKYYNLGEVGGFIWECIQQPKSIANIIEEVIATYNVTSEQCEVDIIPFIEMLKEENLIEVFQM
jgi:hypothetical protein